MKKPWRFTKKGSSSTTANTTSPGKTDTKSSKWYQSIVDLPLSRFIDCVTENNIYALVISGTPDPDQLQASWSIIRTQYAEAMKDQDWLAFARMNREVAQLQIQYTQIHICIDQLKDFYCVQFKKALNTLLSSSFVFDVNDPVKYDEELQRAGNRSKGIKIELDLRTIRLNAMMEKMAIRGDHVGREYYEQVLITLSDEAGYALRIEDMTVYQYCERVRRLQVKAEQLKATKKK